MAKRLGREPRTIGAPGEPRASAYEDDLRDSRGCLLEAGGQVDDALDGGNVPVLLAAECSIALTTLPDRAAPPPRRARCSGSTRTATSTRPTPRRAATSAAWRWRAPAASGTPGWRRGDRPRAGGARRRARPRRGRARGAGAQRGHRDRRQPGRDARGGQERARRRAGVRPPRPRRDRPRGVPGAVPRRRRAAPPEKLYDVLEAVAGDCELVASRSPPSRRPTTTASARPRPRSAAACSSRCSTRSRRRRMSTTEQKAGAGRRWSRAPPLRELVDDLHERREHARAGRRPGEDRAPARRRTSSPRASGSRC